MLSATSEYILSDCYDSSEERLVPRPASPLRRSNLLSGDGGLAGMYSCSLCGCHILGLNIDGSGRMSDHVLLQN